MGGAIAASRKVRGRWTAAVAIPCFNEAQRLDPSALLRFAAAHPDFRFVLVDDASDDGTADLLAQLHHADPERFEPLRLVSNAGQGGAVRAGVLRAIASECTYFGYWDADLAAPLGELPRFVDALEDDPRCLAVYGARVRLLGHRIARPPHRYYLGRLFADAAARALGIGVYDPQCGAKLFRSVPETWALFEPPFRTRWFHDLEILARLIRARGGPDALGGLVRELPLHSWRDVPGSKVRLRDFLLAPFQLARIHLELRAALAPGRAPAQVGNDRALPP